MKLGRMSQENGQVEHTNIELEVADVDSVLAGVCIWRSVPSRGQNHMICFCICI